MIILKNSEKNGTKESGLVTPTPELLDQIIWKHDYNMTLHTNFFFMFSFHDHNHHPIYKIFVIKEVPYDLRTPKLEQPIRRTTNYGLRTFSYLGSKLWNEYLSDFNYTCDMDLDELKFFLKHWEGPSLDPTYQNYVWTLLADLLFGACVLHGRYFICFDLTFYTCIILIPSFISMYRMTLHCIYCTVQSRILACWLMLSVAETTINEVYLILSYLILSYHSHLIYANLHLICFKAMCSIPYRNFSWKFILKYCLDWQIFYVSTLYHPVTYKSIIWISLGSKFHFTTSLGTHLLTFSQI